VDILTDGDYLAQNADITAHCAVKAALQRLPVTLKGLPVLVVGWGRIGKCLGQLLRSMGAAVTIAARKASDRAILAALGYEILDTAALGYELVRFRLVFNTADAMVLPRQALEYCRADCLKIDLASKLGLGGDDVIWARGLPGKEAPESSGALIARSVIPILREESL
jgi:dipicolinate synthase subunit A